MKKSWFPNSLVLIFGIVVLAQLLTYFVPKGEYDRTPAPQKKERMQVVARILREEIERADALRDRLDALEKPRFSLDLQTGLIPCGWDDRMIPTGAAE